MSSQTPTTGLAMLWLNLALLLTALGAIFGAVVTLPHTVDGWQWLHWICKPLATVLIVVLAARAGTPVSARYRRCMLAGLVACLPGDICLMLPGDLFVPGLLWFLFGHLCFIAAFSSDVRLGVRPWPWLACLTVGALVAWRFWPHLGATLKLPVLLYVAALASMAGQALGRAWWLTGQRDPCARSARLAAAGGVMFMLSDTLLGWNRFLGGIAWPALWALGTYYVAVYLLARSVDRSADGIRP